MGRVLVTGMSGVGKTTLLDELGRRGHVTVDTDYDGWTLPTGLWDESRVGQLVADNRRLVMSETVYNQATFYNRLDRVVLLSAPIEVLVERVARRRNNPYGSTPEQRAEIAGNLEEVEPLLRRGATFELDGRRPVAELADIVAKLVDEHSRQC